MNGYESRWIEIEMTHVGISRLDGGMSGSSRRKVGVE
jgi:hypothetical protein